MIIDLCKPLNRGESLTVRIIMTVDEAREVVVKSGCQCDLLHGLQTALACKGKEDAVEGWDDP
jgi:hypothetical protein